MRQGSIKIKNRRLGMQENTLIASDFRFSINLLKTLSLPGIKNLR